MGAGTCSRAMVVVGLMLVAGCAGRQAVPVKIIQTSDDSLSCPQVKAEIEANEVKAKQIGEEQSSAHNRNIAIGVVGGLLFWPALFALDIGDQEKVEIESLHQRNTCLAG